MRRNRPLSSTEKPSKTSTYYHALYLANRFNLQDVCHQHVFWAHDFLRFLCHSFPDFFTAYLPTSHICSTCKIIIKQEEACMKLPLLLIEMICPLMYKSRCFLAPRTSLKSFRCPEATTIHYTTTLLSTIGERECVDCQIEIAPWRSAWTWIPFQWFGTIGCSKSEIFEIDLQPQLDDHDFPLIYELKPLVW